MTKKRFVETISTGIVTDTITKKEYRCEMRIDEDLLELLNELHEENEQLKSEINGLEELLKSYQKTIKHDAELLADASKKGYLPPLKNWREL